MGRLTNEQLFDFIDELQLFLTKWLNVADVEIIIDTGDDRNESVYEDTTERDAG